MGWLYEVRAHVCNARTWGVTYRVPDNSVATLIYDAVEGKLTDKDGTVRTRTGEKFDTLEYVYHL